MIRFSNKRRQSGLTLTEFAIVGAVFILMLLAIIEFGRFLMVLGSLNEATRRAARVAAVCPLFHPSIARVAVFDRPDSSGTASPIVNGLSTTDVVIEYLDKDYNVIAVSDPLDPTIIGTVSRGYVRISIPNYSHRLLIPLFDFIPVGFNPVINTPDYTTIVPMESVGVVPGDAANNACYGISI